PSPPRRTGTGSSGLHREESRRPLQNVALLAQNLHLAPEPTELLTLLGRQPVPLARIHGRLPDPAAHGRLSQVELAADRGQRPLAPAHQGDNLGLELRRERPPLPPACPVPLHLLPHTDSLLVGSRPHLRCPPVRGKSTLTVHTYGAWLKPDRRPALDVLDRETIITVEKVTR